jgi:hypothetical protein
MIKLIVLLIFVVLLTSCDPGFSVVMQNNSGVPKNIEVLPANKRKLDYVDSMDILDSSLRVKIPVVINRNKLSYSFMLEQGKKAILQQGIGGPDLDEIIVINKTDTILLKKDKRVIIKKHGISTSVKVELQ